MRDAGSDPFSGALYVFRAKRADRVKIVWWDGSGVCLFAKRLEKSSFCWPRIGHVRVQLNHVQLMALLAGLDWKRVRPVAVKAPEFAGYPDCGKVNQLPLGRGYPAEGPVGTCYP